MTWRALTADDMIWVNIPMHKGDRFVTSDSQPLPASPRALERLAEYRAAERAAYNAGDLALADRFAADLVLVPNGVQTLKGRETARAFFGEVWSQYQARIVEAVDETAYELGPLLIVTGYFVLELIPRAGGEAVIDKGRYVTVLKLGTNDRYELWREAAVDQGAAD